MTSTPFPHPERRLVSAALAALTAAVASPALSALLASASATLSGSALVLAATFVAASSFLVAAGPPRHAHHSAMAIGTLVLLRFAVGGWVPAPVIAGALGALLGSAFESRLPPELDGAARRRRLLAFGWAILTVLALVQVGRLSAWIADPATDWFLSTRHPFWADHECLSAYLYGAELSERGIADLWDPALYPGLNPQAETTTRVAGMVPEDPYQYPPTFLLLPRFALSVSQDYPTLRALWFALHFASLATIFLALARWIGGRSGRRILLLSPALLLAFPVLHDLQFGQFHLLAVALGVVGLVALEGDRKALGGLALAAAILSKLFPAVLLVPLVARRRWRELAWTAAAGATITLSSLAVVGPTPFEVFATRQLPRLADGSAFAFDEAWPELRELVIADNQGVHGVLVKLSELGVTGAADWVRGANRLFTAGLLILAALVGRRAAALSRLDRAVAWLALLGLGSLASPGAWGDYVPAVGGWLLLLLLADPSAERGWEERLALALCALFQLTLLGTTPLGQWFEPAVMIPLSLVNAATLFGLFGTLALRRALPLPERKGLGEEAVALA